MFAALVPAILLGAAAERSRMLPAMIFIFCWTTVVYDPIAHWVWSANGWAFKWGVLDCKSSQYELRGLMLMTRRRWWTH
jgi:Amt family ammonium transporter